MPVESVDRNSSVSPQKETTDQREKEMIARHRRELADLQRKHQENIRRLRAEYDAAMAHLRNQMREEMSQREKQHVRKVQEVQDLNRKRLQQLKAEDDGKLRASSTSYQNEIDRDQEKDVDDQQRLTKAFDAETSRRDQEDQDMETRYRDASKEALDAQRKRLNEKSDAEKADLRRQVREQMKLRQQETTALRREKDIETEGLKDEMEAQKDRLDSKYMDALNRERVRYDQSVQSLQKDFADSVNMNHEKFRDKAQELSDQYTKNFQTLKHRVNLRIQDQIDSAKNENMDLRQQNVLDRQRMSHNKQSEIGHLNHEFKANFDQLESQRELQLTDAHREKTRDIAEIQRQRDREAARTNSFFVNKLNEQKIEDQSNFNQAVGEAEREKQLANIQKEQTNKKLAGIYADQTNQQESFYQDEHNMQTRNFDKRFSEQRATLEKQRYNDINTLQNKLAKESIEHQQKLAETVANYEKQIVTMRNEYEKRIRRQNELFHEQTEKQVKALEMDREASESKLQARLNQQKETYERELEQLRRRQAAERQELAQKRNT